MKKIFAAAALASALATPAFAADANSIDMSALTCKDLTGLKADDAGVILFWIDGYVSHKTGNTTVNFEGLKADGQQIGQYCGANPDAKVLDYVESHTGG